MRELMDELSPKPVSKRPTNHSSSRSIWIDVLLVDECETVNDSNRVPSPILSWNDIISVTIATTHLLSHLETSCGHFLRYQTISLNLIWVFWPLHIASMEPLIILLLKRPFNPKNRSLRGWMQRLGDSRQSEMLSTKNSTKRALELFWINLWDGCYFLRNELRRLDVLSCTIKLTMLWKTTKTFERKCGNL